MLYDRIFYNNIENLELSNVNKNVTKNSNEREGYYNYY